MRLLRLAIVCILVIPATVMVPAAQAAGRVSAIEITQFSVNRPDDGTARIELKVADREGLFRTFCIRMTLPADDVTPLPGFVVAENGYAYLQGGGVEDNPGLLADNGPLDKNPAPRELSVLLDTSDWPEGRHALSVFAHNRPEPGEYVHEGRVALITVGDPPKLANGGSNIPGAEHGIVFQKEGVYACFPSLTVLPDGKLLTSFGTRTRRSHIDPTGGSHRMISNDGGETWVAYEDNVIPPGWCTDRGELVWTRACGWVYADAEKRDELVAQHKTVRDVRPGTIAYLGGAEVRRSRDGGKTWQREVLDVPDFVSGLMTYHRAASAMKNDNGLRLVAVYGPRVESEFSEVFLIRSDDDGRTWQLRPMYPEGLPSPELGFDETALVQTADGAIHALMRTRPARYLYQTTSNDDGLTWSPPRQTPMHGYPAHVIELHDGRVLCVYGYRWNPMGIRACVSEDAGRTWLTDDELILRSDGLGSPSDLGYPISHQLPDGRIVTIYYHTTDGHNTHIATTHWRVPVTSR